MLLRPLLVLSVIVAFAAAPQAWAQRSHPDSVLARAILQRAEIDQAVLHMPANDYDAANADSLVAAVQRLNASWVQTIIANRGYPRISEVGAEASTRLWLMVQHADHDPDFQREVLAVMTPLHALGEVSGANVAYLTDRIRVAEGRPQVYGTQVERWDGYDPVPFDIEDPKRVDERRAALGMDTLADYFDLFRRNRGYPTADDKE